RVLVADGVADPRQSAGTTLSALGADVVLVASGAEALDRLAESRPDALITDAPMPDLDELDLVRRIRENERETGMDPLPIIALSAHPREKRELAALAAGFSAFLEKPVRAELLASTVRSFVGRG
ncbi:MAG: response regulator, partial [Candidatus Binatia bacterium]